MIREKALKEHVQKYLSTELHSVQDSLRANELKILSLDEKAIIYKYTNDGYESLNEHLRINKGVNDTDYGVFLESALQKLRNHVGVVYRGVHLSAYAIRRYRDALANNSFVKEHTFLSASTLVSIANNVPGVNCLFVISSKTGKAIEKIAKFGLHNPPNEHEVLFLPNVEFRVLDVANEIRYTLITLEEV